MKKAFDIMVELLKAIIIFGLLFYFIWCLPQRFRVHTRVDTHAFQCMGRDPKGRQVVCTLKSYYNYQH